MQRDTHRAAQLVHERGELRAELGADADEGELARLLTGGDRLLTARVEDVAHQLALALCHQQLEREVQRVVVLLDELVLNDTNTPDDVTITSFNVSKCRCNTNCVVDDCAREVADEEALAVGHLTMTLQLRVTRHLRDNITCVTSLKEAATGAEQQVATHGDSVVVLVALVHFVREVVVCRSRQFRLFIQQREDSDSLALDQV